MPGNAPGVHGTPHTVSIVIPVYRGETTLEPLAREIAPLQETTVSPEGNPFRVTEIIMVVDNGPDDSARVVRELASKGPAVRALWLSRNYGQHAATLAGMASSTGDWIVTMDEDGQHDPASIGTLLDSAIRNQVSVVYAKPTNAPPHGFLRNSASRTAKWFLTRLFAEKQAMDFHSYRLVLGAIGRSVAETSGAGAYLDVALSWVAGRAATAPVHLRGETRASGYSTRTLITHFARMMLTSGTRALRFVSWLGITFAVVGTIVAVVLVIERITGSIDVPGWASLSVTMLISSGATLFSLGVIAEYVGVTVTSALGRPSYVIVPDPATGPLGRRPNPGAND